SEGQLTADEVKMYQDRVMSAIQSIQLSKGPGPNATPEEVNQWYQDLANNPQALNLFQQSNNNPYGAQHGGWVHDQKDWNWGWSNDEEGGWVGGRRWGRDSVPTKLEPGEFIVPRRLAAIHAEKLAYLVRTGKWPTRDDMKSVFDQGSSVHGIDPNRME